MCTTRRHYFFPSGSDLAKYGVKFLKYYNQNHFSRVLNLYAITLGELTPEEEELKDVLIIL